LRPRNDQKENELIISILRNMYEEKQKNHVHIGEAKQVSNHSVVAHVRKSQEKSFHTYVFPNANFHQWYFGTSNCWHC